MQDIVSKLNMLLDQVKAPVSQRKVACIIETFGGQYSGINHEWVDPLYFAHAEERALFQMKQSGDFSGIQAIYLAGRGSEKIKQIFPCDNCFNLLNYFISENTNFFLFEPNNLSENLHFTSLELREAYSGLKYSMLKGESLNMIIKELKIKTPLIKSDLSFIANLRKAGIKKDISFFLTGSASGRSGISQLIHQKRKERYSDIDIIAISDLNENSVVSLFEKIASKYYPDLNKKIKKFKIYGTNYPITLNNYFDKKGYLKLELTVGKDKNTTFTRKDYLYKNWYHQIS